MDVWRRRFPWTFGDGDAKQWSAIGFRIGKLGFNKIRHFSIHWNIWFQKTCCRLTALSRLKAHWSAKYLFKESNAGGIILEKWAKIIFGPVIFHSYNFSSIRNKIRCLKFSISFLILLWLLASTLVKGIS